MSRELDPPWILTQYQQYNLIFWHWSGFIDASRWFNPFMEIGRILCDWMHTQAFRFSYKWMAHHMLKSWVIFQNGGPLHINLWLAINLWSHWPMLGDIGGPGRQKCGPLARAHKKSAGLHTLSSMVLADVLECGIFNYIDLTLMSLNLAFSTTSHTDVLEFGIFNYISH